MKAYMALTCKVGAYSRVLDELIKMNLSKKEIFLLFGPVDILVQIRGLKNLNDFIKNWFNPIRIINPQEPMIEKTQTLIVISEGKQVDEEPYAYLFLNTQPRNLEKVQEALQNMPEVLSADTVFGPYDVISAVRVRDKIELQKLIARIQKDVPHIEGTVTAIVSPLY
jgi:DNA-binding Lrp family transcriptional regulator